MKLKVFAILMLAIFSVFAVSKTDMKEQPTDIDTVMFYNNSANSADTFSAYETQNFGPYEITDANGNPMYKGFQLYALPITGTTPTMTMSYQLMPNLKDITDSSSLWTHFDTLDGTGANAYVDLSSKAGQAILFKIYNYDATECQIPDYLIIEYKKNLTYYKDR